MCNHYLRQKAATFDQCLLCLSVQKCLWFVLLAVLHETSEWNVLAFWRFLCHVRFTTKRFLFHLQKPLNCLFEYLESISLAYSSFMIFLALERNYHLFTNSSYFICFWSCCTTFCCNMLFNYVCSYSDVFVFFFSSILIYVWTCLWSVL